MASVPSKHPQPLHNFSLPFLKWGERSIHPNHHCRRRYRNSPPSNSDLNIRPKPHRILVSTNVKPEINEENSGVLPDGGHGSRKLVDVDAAPAAAAAANGDVKPWNLRPRRFVIDVVDGNGAVAGVTSAKSNPAPAPVNEEDRGKKKRRLWISLSKEEIEEDIYAFTGSRPSRRPRKRNKIAQKQLDNVFPGLYLVGVSADSYRV